MVGQFSLEVNRKDEQPTAGGRWCRRQNRQKCGRFIPALTLADASVLALSSGSPGSPPETDNLAALRTSTPWSSPFRTNDEAHRTLDPLVAAM
jgi:hypothetical protein